MWFVFFCCFCSFASLPAAQGDGNGRMEGTETRKSVKRKASTISVGWLSYGVKPRPLPAPDTPPPPPRADPSGPKIVWEGQA